MYKRKENDNIKEIMHILMSVHMQGEQFYLQQIEGIIDYYGSENVLVAEKELYNTVAFSFFCS